MPGEPTFSIIIPTFNRPQHVRRCLQSLHALDTARDAFEVIIVDDGSPTPLDAIVDAERAAGLPVRLERQENAGPAAARNRGVDVSRGRHIAFTDDDCTPDPHWLDGFARQLERTPDALLGGRTINALERDAYAAASQSLITYLYERWNRPAHKASFFTSNNMAMSRETFDALGGFNASYERAAGEDREFSNNAFESGRPMIYLPDVTIRHFHAMTLAKFWRQHFNYGRGAYRYRQFRAGRRQQPVKVEPLDFYTKLLTWPFVESKSWRAPTLSALLLLSQVANTAGFFAARAQAMDRA